MPINFHHCVIMFVQVAADQPLLHRLPIRLAFADEFRVVLILKDDRPAVHLQRMDNIEQNDFLQLLKAGNRPQIARDFLQRQLQVVFAREHNHFQPGGEVFEHVEQEGDRGQDKQEAEREILQGVIILLVIVNVVSEGLFVLK